MLSWYHANGIVVTLTEPVTPVGVAGAVLETASSLINYVGEPFPPFLCNIINHKQYELKFLSPSPHRVNYRISIITIFTHPALHPAITSSPPGASKRRRGRPHILQRQGFLHTLLSSCPIVLLCSYSTMARYFRSTLVLHHGPALPLFSFLQLSFIFFTLSIRL